MSVDSEGCESEERYRVLVERSRVGLYIIQDDLIRFANGRMAEIFGYSREELTGRSYLDLLAPEYHTQAAHGLRAVLEDRAPLHPLALSFQGLTKQGRRINVQGMGVGRISYQGRPAVYGSLIDITERVRAEEALRASEERYRTLVESSPEPIRLLDMEGRYLAINTAGVRILDRPLEDIIGRAYVADFHPEDRPAVAEALARARTGKVARFEARTASALPRPLVLSEIVAPLRGIDGQVQRLLATGWDVTERRRTERELLRAKEELERASRLKDEFLSLASHELKTPVTSIKLMAELAARRPAEVDSSLMMVIVRQAEQLARLINDLLDLSRLGLERVSLRLEPCDLRGLLEEICSLGRRLYPDHPLECRPPERPVHILCERSRLIQVLHNLLDNAAKYSPPGSPIELGVEVGPATLTLSVRDLGAGIDPQDLPHIFERFYKPRTQQAVVPGLGLGLPISKEIVERHGGRIWAESELGRGSTFFVELPLAGGSGAAVTEGG